MKVIIAKIKLTNKVIKFLVVIKVKIKPAERLISKEANDSITIDLFILLDNNIFSKNCPLLITYKVDYLDY
ncbi:hypothetical protein HZA75_02275 [Candidatus Roizmanbacteria bacterium]|nr:hypothetical protein [Candidatus Roizmanbacteria bacterium]